MATAFNHYQPPERGLVHFVLTNLFPTKTGEESLDEPSRSKTEELGKEAMVDEDNSSQLSKNLHVRDKGRV